MRADMFKVIVERPRSGSRHALAAKLSQDKNVDRHFVGLKRLAWEVAPYTKDLNENLAPLKRYLQKQRGRRWDDVFSEICQHLDTGSTVKMHVREHIEDFVMLRIYVDLNGNWLGQDRWHGARSIDHWWPDLYVDPQDGIIKETSALRDTLGLEKRGRYVPQLDPYLQGPFKDFLRLTDTEYLIKRSGCWFRCGLDCDPKCYDAKIRHEILQDPWGEHGGWAIEVMHQLSKKELKRHGLSNVGGRM